MWGFLRGSRAIGQPGALPVDNYGQAVGKCVDNYSAGCGWAVTGLVALQACPARGRLWPLPAGALYVRV